MPHFECVDLVEQDAHFAERARTYCSEVDEGQTDLSQRLGEIYNMGLQQFTPVKQKYDLIWSQWVLGHLTDADLLSFFKRIRSGLTAKGFFVIKDNVTPTKEIVKDETDSSVMRPLEAYETVLKKAGFRIVKTIREQSFPIALYPVYMIASRPQAN